MWCCWCGLVSEVHLTSLVSSGYHPQSFIPQRRGATILLAGYTSPGKMPTSHTGPQSFLVSQDKIWEVFLSFYQNDRERLDSPSRAVHRGQRPGPGRAEVEISISAES